MWLLIGGIVLVLIKFLAYVAMGVSSLAAFGFIQTLAGMWYLWIIGFGMIVYTFFKNLYIVGGVILFMSLLMYFGGFM